MASTFKFIWGDPELLRRETIKKFYKFGPPKKCRRCTRRSCHGCVHSFSYRTRRDDNQSIGKLYMGTKKS